MRRPTAFRITSRLIRNARTDGRKAIGMANFKAQAKKMDGDQVKIGLPAGKKHKASRKGKKQEVLPVAAIGAVHEFGSPSRGIPERPWLRPGIRSGKPDYNRLNKLNITKIMRNEMSPKTALAQLGAMAVGKVQKFIRAGHFKKLKPATIKRKGSSAPLIDTGQMIQSIVFEVGEKEHQ